MSLIAWGVIGSLIVAAFVMYLLYRYSHPDNHLIVNLTVFVSWSLTISSLSFLLPIDLLPEAHRTMFPVWSAVYWSAFVLTWFTIPLLQGYFEAGDFTFKDRMMSSLKDNLKFYGIVGALFVIFIVYIAIKENLHGKQLLGFCICLSNAWGLMLSVLLLGYGLVEVLFIIFILLVVTCSLCVYFNSYLVISGIMEIGVSD